VGRAGPDAVPAHPDALLDAAAGHERLDDFGPVDKISEGLDVILRSLRAEPAIHALGRRHLRTLLLRVLATRLRLYAARKRHPAIDAGPDRPPLIVCGLPRSGTTFLHRLLAEAQDAQALPLWQLMEPIPGRGRDRRIARAEKLVGRMARLAPTSLDAQHLIRPELPDECGHLFKPALRSSILWQAPLYDYLAWYQTQELDWAYEEYRAFLGVLQAPGKRLVLKDPFHCGHLGALFRALPRAMVVQTHREPAELVPSFHKLTLTAHCVLADVVAPARMAKVNTRWLESVADRTIDQRAAIPPSRLLDVSYRSLIADPVGTVRHIHQHFGLPWSEALADRLRGFAGDNGQRKHGDNPYRADDFGQTRAELERRFSRYRERFLAT
jgi:hypothetical protein